MKKFLLFALLALGGALPAQAQQASSALILTACGTLPAGVTYAAGQYGIQTMDTSGKSCSGATFSGSVSATTAATSASALPTLSPSASSPIYESLGAGLYTQPVFGSASGGGTQVDATHGLPVNVIAGGGGAATLAAGSVSAGAYVSGSVLSGAFASGSLASGAVVDLTNIEGVIGNATAPTKMAVSGGVYNSSPLTLTNGQSSALQTDANGYLAVNIKAGAGSGGTALADQATFTQSTTSETPMGCLYTSSYTGGTSGKATVVACTAAGSVHTTVDNSNANGQATMANSSPVVIASNQSNLTVIGAGSAGTANSGVVTVQGIASMTPVLANPGTVANWGVGATGSAVPANGPYQTGLASSSEPTKATTGNLTGLLLDLAGKLVTSPYANRENMLRCAVTITASTAATTCTGMGAQGANVKIYVTDLCVTRSDAGTTADVFTLNDSATTIIDLPNNGGGGGACHTYNVPLVVAANTAFQGTSGTSISSVHMSATGFAGY